MAFFLTIQAAEENKPNFVVMISMITELQGYAVTQLVEALRVPFPMVSL